MSDDTGAPDFAMLRAVEILASIYERGAGTAGPPPPAGKPIVAFSEAVVMAVGVTTRADVERALGIAYVYPARGWHTYCTKARDGARAFTSIFYSNATIASVEIYIPRAERAPKLAARDVHVRLVPSEVEVGAPVTLLPEHFGRMSLPDAGRANFEEHYEARFPGGTAYAMANGGTIERLALYVLRDSTSQA